MRDSQHVFLVVLLLACFLWASFAFDYLTVVTTAWRPAFDGILVSIVTPATGIMVYIAYLMGRQ